MWHTKALLVGNGDFIFYSEKFADDSFLCLMQMFGLEERLYHPTILSFIILLIARLSRQIAFKFQNAFEKFYRYAISNTFYIFNLFFNEIFNRRRTKTTKSVQQKNEDAGIIKVIVHQFYHREEIFPSKCNGSNRRNQVGVLLQHSNQISNQIDFNA